MKDMKRQSGFTVIELLSVLFITFAVAALGFIQKNNIDASNRDKERKTSINALFYGLKDGYYKQYGFYPAAISEKKIPYINKSSFKDPAGKKINAAQADYHYIPKNCTNEKCKSFELKANLEREADYKKLSQ